MGSSYTIYSINCPQCDAPLDIAATVISTTNHHPYGSTTAAEHHTEVDLDEPGERCWSCGEPTDEDTVANTIIDKFFRE